MKDELIIHDISLTLTDGMVAYPKDVPYQRRLQRNLEKGDSSSVSVVQTTVHVGTHVDAPRHFYADGYAIDKIPLDHLYGPAFIADCRRAPAVTADMLAKIVPAGIQRLLLKTDNSKLLGNNPQGSFNEKFVYLDGIAAQFCVDNDIKLVGIDYLSIDKFGSDEKPAHHILLKNNITILEGIILDQIEAGEYFLACGPLKMSDSDGAPCRAVLMQNLNA